jgi:membrane protein
VPDPVDSSVSLAPPLDRQYRKGLLTVRWQEIAKLLEDSFAGWNKHNVPLLGAALSFYALLSFMPLLLLVISIAGLVFGPRAAQAGVLQQVQILFGAQRAKIMEALLVGAQSKADGLVAAVIGSLTLMFGASGMLTELRHALDKIWEVPVRQLTTFQEITNYVRERLWSFGLVIGICLLLIMSVSFTTWVSALGARYTTALPGHEVTLHILTAIASLVMITGVFAAVYKTAPEISVEWRDVILGAAVTSLLFTLGNLVLGIYLGKASFSSTYGAAASVVVLALWVYYSSQIFFFGAEFTKAYSLRYGSWPHEQPLVTPK